MGPVCEDEEGRLERGNTSSMVCSAHFTPTDDYNWQMWLAGLSFRLNLRPDAVPTVFYKAAESHRAPPCDEHACPLKRSQSAVASSPRAELRRRTAAWPARIGGKPLQHACRCTTVHPKMEAPERLDEKNMLGESRAAYDDRTETAVPQ
ncbi:hypothetical protein SKAU_G00247790 [Synaphobranchus kaupii]|uniref:Uncharacterized protein n=1 Tax=Synaphobranchus kaupii TaxID=118154 RepID=A0A9Q1F288_SYNKA|nr:hypothetical protein SKAU_G00247790 [Synaphobranchus kaupii]